METLELKPEGKSLSAVLKHVKGGSAALLFRFPMLLVQAGFLGSNLGVIFDFSHPSLSG